jgi:hypothetical protein
VKVYSMFTIKWGDFEGWISQREVTLCSFRSMTSASELIWKWGQNLSDFQDLYCISNRRENFNFPEWCGYVHEKSIHPGDFNRWRKFNFAKWYVCVKSRNCREMTFLCMNHIERCGVKVKFVNRTKSRFDRMAFIWEIHQLSWGEYRKGK